MNDNDRLTQLFTDVRMEHQRAISKFPPFNSAHEGLAIIEEEFEELKAEVFKKKEARSYPNMKNEATQLADMALRFILDVVEGGGKNA
jgi:hypothetical protein